MSTYVYCQQDGIAYNGPNVVTMHRGSVWDADDPFVKARPEFFSATPVVVHNTTGAAQPEPTPVENARRAPGERRVAVKKPTK